MKNIVEIVNTFLPKQILFYCLENFNNISLTILDQQVYIEETPFKAFFEGGGRLNLTQSNKN